MIGLIDADLIVFRAGFAAERNLWFLKLMYGRQSEFEPDTVQEFQYKKDANAALDKALPGIHSRVEGEDYQLWSERKLEPVENALHNVNVQVNKIKDALSLNDDDLHMFLSGGENYRFAIAKTRPYKGTRDKSHRPTHEHAIKKFISTKWRTTTTDGIEADDALGIAQTDETIIISIDKDLDMIPGKHYNFMHDVAYEISESEAQRAFALQMLMGDSTDCIPGLPKVGKKKAESILEGVEIEELIPTVVREYASRAGENWWEYMHEQAQLLWIQREPDQLYTFDESYNDYGGEPDDAITTDLFG